MTVTNPAARTARHFPKLIAGSLSARLYGPYNLHTTNRGRANLLAIKQTVGATPRAQGFFASIINERHIDLVRSAKTRHEGVAQAPRARPIRQTKQGVAGAGGEGKRRKSPLALSLSLSLFLSLHNFYPDP